MNIFVGCSSRDTKNEKYNEIATEIGKFIVERGYNLVFGGCKYGLMGKVYSEIASNRNNSKIIVSISEAYKDQLNEINYDEIYSFSKMSERKNKMIELADIIIFLPGGIGTIDELMTAIETKRNTEQVKPIIIANIEGYFDEFFKMIDKAIEEKFADPENKKLYDIAYSSAETINKIKEIIDK